MTNTELTKIREDKKLSKAEFAKHLGVTPMLLGKYEKGSCEIPDDIHLRKSDLADEIFVTNAGGYIGSSTKAGIGYAEKTGKAVWISGLKAALRTFPDPSMKQ